MTRKKQTLIFTFQKKYDIIYINLPVGYHGRRNENGGDFLSIGFKVKQLGKMLLQNAVLPLMYRFFAKKPVKKGLVIFADAHHNECPFSMKIMRLRVGRIEGLDVRDFYIDMQDCSDIALVKYIVRFMSAYARAEYVFICDNFLPVSSCKKREGTKVIQLWHSGGLLKKAGYDSQDCIPKGYKGEVYKNYDLWTVSAPCVVPVMASSTHQKKENVKALGISRTDAYFNERYNALCREKFFERYPEAYGKTIVLWAPTFRGNAAEPYVVGEEEVTRVCKEMGYYLIKKLHPHMENAEDIGIPAERLFAVADLMITDYSSIVFDYLAYDKPFVFFAPDLEKFKAERGFYVDYESFPTTVAKDTATLRTAMLNELNFRRKKELTACYEYHMQNCDGHSTDRILKEIGLKK